MVPPRRRADDFEQSKGAGQSLARLFKELWWRMRQTAKSQVQLRKCYQNNFIVSTIKATTSSGKRANSSTSLTRRIFSKSWAGRLVYGLYTMDSAPKPKKPRTKSSTRKATVPVSHIAHDEILVENHTATAVSIPESYDYRYVSHNFRSHPKMLAMPSRRRWPYILARSSGRIKPSKISQLAKWMEFSTPISPSKVLDKGCQP